MKRTDAKSLVWKFQRLGGLDQVTLRSAVEIASLRELDPKLWAALSCPASGLEFDQRTLALLDTDQDGRIRAPEVLDAVDWLCERLKDPSAIVEAAGELPLDYIRDDNEAGRVMRAEAEALLRDIGKPDALSLSREDVERARAEMAGHAFNGDGVLPPLEDFGPLVAAFIRDALAVKGGVGDRSGSAGIDKDIALAFMRDLRAYEAWRKDVDEAARPLGPDAAEAWEALQSLADKLDDYFLRCDLAAFAPEKTAAEENVRAACFDAAAGGLLDKGSLASLPLSRIEADKPLHLKHGLNPAWQEAVFRFVRLVVEPLLGGRDELDKEDWRGLRERFAPYAQALAARPLPEETATDVPLRMPVDSLGDERVRELLSGEAEKTFMELADKDLSLTATDEAITDCERLLLYYRHLHHLLMNFVSFFDFYSMRGKAAFQSGVLYLDGRACSLCLPAPDPAAHAALASRSELCLVYCDCRRREGGAEARSMGIVAAMTAGDSDLLLTGRNGVYIDNSGADWDAVVSKVVSNPISIREALWLPYKRLGRMISEQAGKLAGARQAALQEKMAAQVAGISSAPPPATAPGAAPAQPFDIGRSVGIFAAIGLALGAIGTAVATLASALFALRWWQYPLLIFALFLVISGPSIILAWLKLKKRNLGPLLEASGWAVNKRLPVNLLMGRALTTMAFLPPNSSHCYRDPLQKPARWPWLAALLLLALLAGGGWLWYKRDTVDLSGARELLREAVSVPEHDKTDGAGAALSGNATAKEGASPVDNATTGKAAPPVNEAAPQVK